MTDLPPFTSRMSAEQLKSYQKYTERVPFDVVSFAHDIGINVLSSDELPPYETYRLTANRMFSASPYTLVLNNAASVEKLRVATAHAIVHVVCHNEYLKKEGTLVATTQQRLQPKRLRDLFRRETKPDLGVATAQGRARMKALNQYAHEMLIPEEHLIDVWSRSTNPARLAEYFAVTPGFFQWRAQNIMSIMPT